MEVDLYQSVFCCWKFTNCVIQKCMEELWVTVEDCNFWFDSISKIFLAVKVPIFFDIASKWTRKDWTVSERDSVNGGASERMVLVTEELHVEIDAWSACSVLSFVKVEGFPLVEVYFLPRPNEILFEKAVIYVVIIV